MYIGQSSQSPHCSFWMAREKKKRYSKPGTNHGDKCPASHPTIISVVGPINSVTRKSGPINERCSNSLDSSIEHSKLCVHKILVAKIQQQLTVCSMFLYTQQVQKHTSGNIEKTGKLAERPVLLQVLTPEVE